MVYEDQVPGARVTLNSRSPPRSSTAARASSTAAPSSRARRRRSRTCRAGTPRCRTRSRRRRSRSRPARQRTAQANASERRAQARARAGAAAPGREAEGRARDPRGAPRGQGQGLHRPQRGLVIRLVTDQVLFALGSYELRPAGRPAAHRTSRTRSNRCRTRSASRATRTRCPARAPSATTGLSFYRAQTVLDFMGSARVHDRRSPRRRGRPVRRARDPLVAEQRDRGQPAQPPGRDRASSANRSRPSSDGAAGDRRRRDPGQRQPARPAARAPRRQVPTDPVDIANREPCVRRNFSSSSLGASCRPRRRRLLRLQHVPRRRRQGRLAGEAPEAGAEEGAHGDEAAHEAAHRRADRPARRRLRREPRAGLAHFAKFDVSLKVDKADVVARRRPRAPRHRPGARGSGRRSGTS